MINRSNIIFDLKLYVYNSTKHPQMLVTFTNKNLYTAWFNYKNSRCILIIEQHFNWSWWLFWCLKSPLMLRIIKKYANPKLFRVNSSVFTSAQLVNWPVLISKHVSFKFSLVQNSKNSNLFSLDLLEKARVISQQPLERSYHIFYQMMSGAVPNLKGKWVLTQTKKYTYYIFILLSKLVLQFKVR